MKKIILINVVVLLVASVSFAESLGKTDFSATGLTLKGGKSGATADKVIAKTSTGVTPGVNSDASGYAAITQHQNGTKAFGSSFDSTALYSKDVTKGTFDGDPSTADSTDFESGWTSM